MIYIKDFFFRKILFASDTHFCFENSLKMGGTVHVISEIRSKTEAVRLEGSGSLDSHNPRGCVSRHLVPVNEGG